MISCEGQKTLREIAGGHMEVMRKPCKALS